MFFHVYTLNRSWEHLKTIAKITNFSRNLVSQHEKLYSVVDLRHFQFVRATKRNLLTMNDISIENCTAPSLPWEENRTFLI